MTASTHLTPPLQRQPGRGRQRAPLSMGKGIGIGIGMSMAQAASLALLCLFGGAAHAGGGNRLAAAPAAYLEECGSCHVPYPAGLLSARDWRTTLDGLQRHFGADASLAAAEASAIRAYLLDNAAPAGGRHDASRTPPRLTQTPWFERKHLRKLPTSVWANPKVKSAANCGACHAGADKGQFAESDISVPGHPGRHW